MQATAIARILSGVALTLAVGFLDALAPDAQAFTVTVQANSNWCTPAPDGAFSVGDNDAPYFSFRCAGDLVLRGDPDGTATAGQEVSAEIEAPPGITITGASAVGSVSNAGTGWAEDSYFYGGSAAWYSGGALIDPTFASPYWGFQVYCPTSCSGAGQIALSSVALSATESQGPSVTPLGPGNLWGQNRPGEWIWNSPGDPWPIALAASDPSGVCSVSATVGAHSELLGPSAIPDSSMWQQCPDPTWTPTGGASVDTQDYISGAASLPITIDAVNAAGLTTSESETLQVDNDPVGLSLATTNDPNPSVWVNHAVTVDATATAGPSGVGGTTCTVDHGLSRSYPAAGLSVDGDGVHTVSCTAWNNAVGPQGQPNETTQSTTLRIDEAPPTIAFEPQNPQDPTGLVVEATDSESGVASGSLEMAPAGSNNWTNLPANFAGAQLATHFDDADHSGPYVFRATACDNVGNCASTTKQLTLPLRIASDSEVSLTRIVNPVRRRVVDERILVGWHWVTVRRDGKLVRIKVGGHFKTIKVLEVVEPCTTRRAKSGQQQRICTRPKTKVTASLQVPYGHRFTIHGLYSTAQGAPLPGEAVHIFAAPDNHTNAFRPVTSVTTAADGSWTATLPPGPSQLIRAVTDGTATVLPSSSQVTTIVPAKIRLVRVWPRRVSWGGTVHLVGQLLGGYLPAGGALVRLRIGYKSTYETYGVEEHVSGDGRFSTVASFGPGDPSMLRTYWFQIASLPMGNYPYAPAASQRVPVVVGGHPQTTDRGRLARHRT